MEPYILATLEGCDCDLQGDDEMNPAYFGGDDYQFFSGPGMYGDPSMGSWWNPKDWVEETGKVIKKVAKGVYKINVKVIKGVGKLNVDLIKCTIKNPKAAIATTAAIAGTIASYGSSSAATGPMIYKGVKPIAKCAGKRALARIAGDFTKNPRAAATSVAMGTITTVMEANAHYLRQGNIPRFMREVGKALKEIEPSLEAIQTLPTHEIKATPTRRPASGRRAPTKKAFDPIIAVAGAGIAAAALLLLA